MSFLHASMWVVVAHFAFLWLVAVTITVREGAARDPFSHVICQAAAYLMILFIILRVHSPETDIGEVAGLRRTHPGFYALAALAGAAVSLPATWVYARLEERLSSPEQNNQFIELFFDASQSQQLLLGFGIAVIGPVVEELLFRGAIFGPLLRRGHSPVWIVVFTAGTFALVHHEPSRVVPIFLVGLLLGYLRLASRSLFPPIILHASFNIVPLVSLFSADGPPAIGEAADEPALITVLIASSVVALLLVAMHHLSQPMDPS